MSSITFNGLNLQDGANFVVSDINYRSFANRPLDSAKLTRRPGEKFYYTDFGPKHITVDGVILGTTASGLQGNIDSLQQNLATKEAALIINADTYVQRTYTATCASLAIPEKNYTQTMVPFSADFIANDPFAYGTALTVSGTVVSGTVTYSGLVTISGTVFAEPTINIYPTSLAAGNSGIKAFEIGYTPAGETLTLSGVINYTAPIVFSYSNFTVTNSGINGDFNGAFSRWEPGSTAFTITTTSGLHNGYNWVINYQPRYYS